MSHRALGSKCQGLLSQSVSFVFPAWLSVFFGYSSFSISKVILPQKVYLQKAYILDWGTALKCNTLCRIWNKMLLLQSTLFYSNYLGQLPAEELAVVLQERTRWRKASLPHARTDFFTLQFKLVQVSQNFGCEDVSTLRICLLQNEKHHHPQLLVTRPFLGITGEKRGSSRAAVAAGTPSSLGQQDVEPTEMFSTPSMAKVAQHTGGKILHIVFRLWMPPAAHAAPPLT